MSEPIRTTSDTIRMILGATGDNLALLDNTDIEHALSLYPRWQLAAAFLAEALAARAINNPQSFGLTGTMSVSWPDRASTWLKMASQLRKEAALDQQIEITPVGMQSRLLHREAMQAEQDEYRGPERRRKKGWS